MKPPFSLTPNPDGNGTHNWRLRISYDHRATAPIPVSPEQAADLLAVLEAAEAAGLFTDPDAAAPLKARPDRYVAVEIDTQWGIVDMGGAFPRLKATVIGGMTPARELASVMSAAVALPGEPFA